MISGDRIRTSRDIGHLVRDARKMRGWTQQDLARRLNVHQPWISSIENGKDTASIGLVLRLIGILDIDLAPIPRGGGSPIDRGGDDDRKTVPAIDIDDIVDPDDGPEMG